MTVKKLTNSVIIDTGFLAWDEKDRIRHEHMRMLKSMLLEEVEKYIEIEKLACAYPHEERINTTIFIASEEDYRPDKDYDDSHSPYTTTTARHQLNTLKEEIKKMLVGMEAGKWLGPNDVKALREKLERLTF